MKGILVILACAVAGYVIVTLLMNTKADDLRPPPDREPGRPPRSEDDSPRQPTPASRALPAPRAAQGDWTLLLDLPRSSSPRDIEAAFRRQMTKAEATGDRSMVERLQQARAAALAERKGS
jgi:hypothetical protein